MIPTFKMHGSKCRIRKWILDRYGDVDFNNYYEPFAGRGNISFYAVSKLNCTKYYINDLYLYKFLNALKYYGGDYTFVPEYIDREIYSIFNNMKPSFEKILAESFCAYNGNFYGAGANITDNPNKPSKNRHNKQRTISRFKIARSLLQKVNIVGGLDYSTFLDKYVYTKNDIIYCDPPYLNTMSPYPNIDHNKFLDIITKISCLVVVSGYMNDLYVNKLGEPAHIKSRSSCAKNSNGNSGKALECLWIINEV